MIETVAEFPAMPVEGMRIRRRDRNEAVYVFDDGAWCLEVDSGLHLVGDTHCVEGWCDGGNYPASCECGGLIHAEFGGENAGFDYWIYTKCDQCGESE